MMELFWLLTLKAVVVPPFVPKKYRFYNAVRMSTDFDAIAQAAHVYRSQICKESYNS